MTKSSTSLSNIPFVNAGIEFKEGGNDLHYTTKLLSISYNQNLGFQNLKFVFSLGNDDVSTRHKLV